MVHEYDFICWHANQNEGDGKEIKASSVQSAAKKAVDVWRHENLQELNGNKVTVYVRDEDKRIYEVIITDAGSTPEAPEAFL